ncbi:MAG: winged helix-turn-helix domain-containing protein [Caulobacteraceae bacterium]
MNDAVAAIALGRRIDLTRQADFVIGGVQIRPTACEVVAGGRRIRLQPRVMQVLVALARAGGEPVSREALVEVCWGQIRVGDDALNRCIQRLRRLAEAEVGGAFVIETIPRLGYRLAPAGEGASAALAPQPPLLAVLAFDNLCGDADMTWFSDGVSEEIQQTVARRADLKVIGRTSSFQFRGADKAIARVAAELKATHVLDGSVRRDGPRVRIAAQLIECAGHTALWSGHFDRDLTDIFTLQDEIAGAVGAALEVAFAPTTSAPAIDPETYDIYLRARAMITGGGDEQMRLLETVTSRAPAFAPGWALLAYIRATLGRFESAEGFSNTARASAREMARIALHLDPRSGLAHAALSWVEPYASYLKRENLLSRARAEAPDDIGVLAAMVDFYSSVGRLEDAFASATLAYKLDSLNAPGVISYANALFQAGSREESLKVFGRARDRWPDAETFTAIPLQLCAFHGDWEAFDALAGQVNAIGSPTPHVLEGLFAGRALRDPNPKIRARILDILTDELARSGTILLGPVVLAYKLGLNDDVFERIGEASFEHLFDPRGLSPGGWYNATVIFSSATDIDRDRRFPGFCAKLGLCDYWVKTDRWPDCAADGAVPYDFKAECRRLAAA